MSGPPIWPPDGRRSRFAAAACTMRISTSPGIRAATNGSAASSASAPACGRDFDNVNSDSIRFLGRAVGVGCRRRRTWTCCSALCTSIAWTSSCCRSPACTIARRRSGTCTSCFPIRRSASSSPTIGNTKWYGYAAGEYGGGSWTVERQDDRRPHRLQRHPRHRRPRMGNANAHSRPHRSRLRLGPRNHVRLRRPAQLHAGRHVHDPRGRGFLARATQHGAARDKSLLRCQVTTYLDFSVRISMRLLLTLSLLLTMFAAVRAVARIRRRRCRSRLGAATRCPRRCRISRRCRASCSRIRRPTAWRRCSSIRARCQVAPMPPLQEPLYPADPTPTLRESLTPPDARNGFFQKAKFQATWMPQFEDDSLGWTDLRTDIVTALPFFTRENPIIITPSYELHFLDSPRRHRSAAATARPGDRLSRLPRVRRTLDRRFRGDARPVCR